MVLNDTFFKSAVTAVDYSLNLKHFEGQNINLQYNFFKYSLIFTKVPSSLQTV